MNFLKWYHNTHFKSVCDQEIRIVAGKVTFWRKLLLRNFWHPQCKVFNSIKTKKTLENTSSSEDVISPSKAVVKKERERTTLLSGGTGRLCYVLIHFPKSTPCLLPESAAWQATTYLTAMCRVGTRTTQWRVRLQKYPLHGDRGHC